MILPLILFSLAMGPANLSVDPVATCRIESADPTFLSGFDIYSAATREAPLALLLDLRGDDYRIASPLWGDPLPPEEILYALRRLKQQHEEPSWCLPLPPAALRVVNRKGEVLGYVYTSLRIIFMERREDGSVTVFLPDHAPCEDGEDWPWRGSRP